MVSRDSYKDIEIRQASLTQDAMKSFRKDGSSILDQAKEKRQGQELYPYSYSHDIQAPDIFFQSVANNDILKSWATNLGKIISEGNPPTFDPRDENFKVNALSLSFMTQDGKKKVHFLQLKTPNIIRMFKGGTTAYIIKNIQIEIPDTDGVFFYTPSLYLVLFGDFCFIYAKKNFEKLFLPTEYLTAELDQFHAKVSSHVKFVNGGDLFKTHVQTKPKWIRDYFIVSQRDDLEKFSNTTQLAKANKRLKCGVQFNDNGEIRVTKGTVSNVLDLLISYGGKDIVTGAFVKARKLTGRTKAEKLELEQRKVDS